MSHCTTWNRYTTTVTRYVTIGYLALRDCEYYIPYITFCIFTSGEEKYSRMHGCRPEVCCCGRRFFVFSNVFILEIPCRLFWALLLRWLVLISIRSLLSVTWFQIVATAVVRIICGCRMDNMVSIGDGT